MDSHTIQSSKEAGKIHINFVLVPVYVRVPLYTQIYMISMLAARTIRPSYGAPAHVSRRSTSVTQRPGRT